MADLVLIVDDDQAVLTMLYKVIRSNGLLADTADSGERCLELFAQKKYDLILLDVMMPDVNGFELCNQIRSRVDCPIIFLTAKTQESDIVRGLGIGGDDYITKPFSLAVLRARINAQLRRHGQEKKAQLVLGPFAFDFDKMEFRREDKPVELSKTEQKLLRMLVENRGRTLTRGQLVDRVWSDGAEFVEENALSVTVRRLRSKLEADPAHPRYLKTVYGIGYTWEDKE